MPRVYDMENDDEYPIFVSLLDAAEQDRGEFALILDPSLEGLQFVPGEDWVRISPHLFLSVRDRFNLAPENRRDEP